MKIAEISINYKSLKTDIEPQKICTSQDAAKFLRSIWSERIEYVEESYLILLNRANKILGYLKLSEGGTSGTVVDVKMILQASLKANAHGIILFHNHPSSSLKPSNEDILLTKRVKEAAKTMDVLLLDHIILTADSYYSFADEGML